MITSVAARKASFAEKIRPSFPPQGRYSRSEGSGREQGRGETSHFRRCDVLPEIQDFWACLSSMVLTLCSVQCRSPAKRDYVSPSLGISLEVEFDAGQEHELPFASPRSNSPLERRS